MVNVVNMSNYLKPLLCLFIMLFITGCAGHKTRRSSRMPNVILISVDTLRPDHLGCYGYNRDTSPNLDRFAEEGLLFEACFSHAPHTGPSCTTFLSGFLPHETNVILNDSIVHTEVPMLAEILKDDGFKTYGVVSNFVLREGKGFEQGFDIYDARMGETELNRRHICERTAKKTTDCAINILKNHSGNPFMLWIHYQDPHGPYTPPPQYHQMFHNPNQKSYDLKLNQSLRGKGGIPSYQRLQDHHDYFYYVAQYDGEIRYFDEHFGRLIAFLKKGLFFENSIIIFTADHGEAMGEHDYYFAHGHGLTNDLIHVPLIIRYRDELRGRKKDPVQHLDIVPTILHRVRIQGDFTYRGRNLLADPLEASTILSELHFSNSAVISDGMKLIMYGENAFLFDIQKDFYENRNLANQFQFRSLLGYLVNERQRMRNKDLLCLDIAPQTPELTREEKEKLRSLGYIEEGT